MFSSSTLQDTATHSPTPIDGPGDLVFFGTNLADSRSISHVGIYIENGLMVDAPHTGAVVRIEAIAGWPDYFGATRPG
jgi:cell wall-associated NlpC family hydrolase